jgi:hypothetical protein
MSGFGVTTDVVQDPFGRLLIADFNSNAIYLLSPPPDGDANLDRNVDVADLGMLASNWQTTGSYAQGDFDGNGWIDVNDLGLLASNWQSTGNISFANAVQSVGLPSVPEPGLLLGAVLTIPLSLKRPRRRFNA